MLNVVASLSSTSDIYCRVFFYALKEREEGNHDVTKGAGKEMTLRTVAIVRA